MVAVDGLTGASLSRNRELAHSHATLTPYRKRYFKRGNFSRNNFSHNVSREVSSDVSHYRDPTLDGHVVKYKFLLAQT